MCLSCQTAMNIDVRIYPCIHTSMINKFLVKVGISKDLVYLGYFKSYAFCQRYVGIVNWQAVSNTGTTLFLLYMRHGHGVLTQKRPQHCAAGQAS